MKLDVASPCREPWASMTPVAGESGERVRNCQACKLNVFTISDLTEAEILSLLSRNGRVCGRILRRSDGTVLTKDCPKGLAAIRRRVVGGVVLAVSMLLSVLGYGLDRARRGCPTSSGTWFDRVVTTRLYGAREELRNTKTLGPLVNEAFPIHAAMKGDIVMVRPTVPAPTP